jgi:tRNA(Ile)-lysidine synthase
MAGRRSRTGADGGEAERFAADLTRVAGEGGTLALAVSGGPDSMALLILAAAARPGRVMAATVDHRLRPESADEASMVARECAAIGVSHATLVPDSPIAGASLQARARDVRYQLLAAWARAQGADALATAHHADDQAETFLMRAARGAGLSGLAGIRARVEIEGVPVVRPLLDWRRAELRAIVRRAGAPFADDPANHDLRHDRTRFRQLLEQHEWLGVPQLAAAAAQLAEIDADVRATAAWLWAERATEDDGAVALDVAGLPPELRRRLVRRAVSAVRETNGMVEPAWSEAGGVEPLLDALSVGSSATRAGVKASAKGDVWRFRTAPPRRAAAG